PSAYRSLGFRFRGVSVGLSRRDPVLERGYSDTTAISVSADCRWLRSGERGVALVGSMDCFAAVGDGRDFVLGRRSAWLELSDTGDFNGVLFGLLAAVSGAYYTLASSPLVRDLGSWWVTSCGFAIDCLVTVP